MSDSSSLLSHLISTLKQHYPDTRIVAEFLTYQDHQYAVRALIKHGSEVLTTGMAADPNIEVAEDRAKIRAIEALGITQTLLSNQDQGNKAGVITNASPQSSPTRSHGTPSVPARKSKGEMPYRTELPKLSHSSPSLPEENTPNVSDDLLTKASETSGNISLLDQIAKTDVEMKRLGWDVEQGRLSLTQRYGKRSRRELTDDEVLDFLEYLEKQP